MENESDHAAVRPVDEWDTRLRGYEPQSEPLCPHREDEQEALRRAVRDAAGTDFHLVRDRRGRMAVWRRAHDFWG